ncbi:hypothetical protein vseg_010323 [Gypsophila vaccaria]
MCHAGNACSYCYRNCLLMHTSKHGNHSMGPSFFKIMFGQKFEDFLAVPPAYSKKIKSLAGRKIFLEDCNRQRWGVFLTNVKGSLTLGKGWHNFVMDHEIEMGDLLVFHYFKDSHFLVEIFGRSGCQKRFHTTNKNRSTEVTRSSIPSKRPYDSSSEQSAQKRHFSSNAFSEPDIDVIPRPKNVRAMKEPSVMAKKVSGRGHMAASQEKNSPKGVPVDETLMEPCFVSSRDKTAASEYDRDCLFDLSAFEMPDKKSIVDREEETYYVPDLPSYDLPENETNADRAENVHVQGNTSSQVSATFQNPSTEIADDQTNINIDNVGDCLLDMSVFEMPENEYTNVIDKGHLQENLQGQESDNYHNVEIEDASTDFLNLKVSEKVIVEVLSEYHEIELPKHDDAPLSSSSPTVDLPIDSTIPLESVGKPETSELATLSGEKMRSNNQEVEVCNQEFISNAEGESSLAASSPTSEQNYGNLGATTKSSVHMMNDKGENTTRTDLETREVKQVKQDMRGAVMTDSYFGTISSIDEQTKISSRMFDDNINPMIKIEADVNTIVKLEPVDCDAPLKTDLKVSCLVPPGTENLLVLPKPLKVAVRVDRRRVKPKHQLVLLRDQAGRDWPVVYHNNSSHKTLTSGWNSFMKANSIQPGNECIFTPEHSSEGSLFTVEVVRHN